MRLVRGARLLLVAAAVVTAAACSSSDDADMDPAWPGLLLWTDINGRTQPWQVVHTSPGPEHCGWQSAMFLGLNSGSAATGTQYLRDPAGVVPGPLAASFATDVELPPDARDSGFRREGVALWLTPHAAYLVAADATERWPRAVDGIGCA